MIWLTVGGSYDDPEEVVGYIYAHYIPNMMKCARKYLDNGSDAEDAVYEALSKIYFTKAAINNIDTNEGLGFVLTVVKNVCIDMQRKKNRENVTYVDEAELDRYASGSDIPDYTVEEILEAIDELDRIYRDVLIMHSLDSLSSSEIGKILGIKPSTARARLTKGRKLLLIKLKERGINV